MNGGEWEPSFNQRVFAAALAKMIAPMQATEATIAIMPMLAAAGIRELPGWVFNKPADLALDIGADMLGMPNLARLQRALVAWHEAHEAKRSAAGGHLDMPMPDRCMVSFWHEYRSGTKDLPPGVTLESWLDTFRNATPAAIRHICLIDAVAGEIADRRGWFREHSRSTATLEEIAAVAAKLRPWAAEPAIPGSQPPPASSSSEAGAARPAPRFPSLAEHVERRHGRKPGALSSEHLAIFRKADPILNVLQQCQTAQDRRFDQSASDTLSKITTHAVTESHGKRHTVNDA